MGGDAGRPNGTTDYREAFERIRAEYLEMPGMRLTAHQVHRLSGVDVSICETVLADLVRAGFLAIAPDGTYLRATTERAPSLVERTIRRSPRTRAAS